MIKFQYNKTSLNDMGKQLKVRQNALPTLKNKESALRLEVRKAKAKAEELLRDLDASLKRYDYLASLWNEFEPGLISVTGVGKIPRRQLTTLRHRGQDSGTEGDTL